MYEYIYFFITSLTACAWTVGENNKAWIETRKHAFILLIPSKIIYIPFLSAIIIYLRVPNIIEVFLITRRPSVFYNWHKISIRSLGSQEQIHRL